MAAVDAQWLVHTAGRGSWPLALEGVLAARRLTAPMHDLGPGVCERGPCS